MISTEDKMYQVSKHFGDLNSKGKVKGFGANEKGYARIKNIVNGCGLLVHHTNDEELILDVMVSPTALSRYGATCQRVISTFKNILGSEVRQRKWTNAMGNSGEWDQYFINVTNRELPDILRLIDELKVKMINA